MSKKTAIKSVDSCLIFSSADESKKTLVLLQEKALFFVLYAEKTALKSQQICTDFLIQSNNYVADVLGEKVISRNNNRELDQELDSVLKHRNVSQNLSNYNIEYMR